MGAFLFRPISARFSRFQETRRHSPATTIVGNNGNRFPVVTSEHSDTGGPFSVGRPRGPRYGTGAWLGARAPPSAAGGVHDAMIQVYEFSFGQVINRNAVHADSSNNEERPVIYRKNRSKAKISLQQTRARKRDGARTIPLRIVVTREVAVPNYTDLDGCQLR